MVHVIKRLADQVLGRFGLEIARKQPNDDRYWTDEYAYWLAACQAFYRGNYGLELDPRQTDPAMVPPVELAGLIQFPNKSHRLGYFATGLRTTLMYQRELLDCGASPQRMESILEFGVGLGRLLVHYLPFNAALHGCDVTDEVYRWTAGRFDGLADIRRTSLTPPLPYEDGRFDFIYANSVFTHVPGQMVAGWVDELARILRPNGLFIFSTLDPNHYLRFMSPRDFDRIAAGDGRHEWNVDLGVKMMYFATHDRLQQDWGRRFRIVGINQHFKDQSHVVCRRL